jgi:hypothetical protein
VAVVDEQAGIVLLWMNFGDTHSYGPGRRWSRLKHSRYLANPFTLLTLFGFLPKETERNWPSAE